MSSTPLYRAEVAEAQRSKWLGTIIIAPPLTRWLVTTLAVAIAGAIVLFLLYGHYTRHATVMGLLAPDPRMRDVVAPSVGVVHYLHVHVGEAVKAGDALMDFAEARGHKGYQDISTPVERKLNPAETGGAVALPELDTRRSDSERGLGGASQPHAHIPRQHVTVLRTPRDGVVCSVQVKAGQSVRDGQPLISLRANDSALQVHLFVPSQVVGSVTPGKHVVLRYDAYPYQKFGPQYGTVTSVSNSALSPSQAEAIAGRPVQQRLYLVKVRPDQQYIIAHGKKRPLKLGMVLSADILMDRHSLLEWAFEKFFTPSHRLIGKPNRG